MPLFDGYIAVDWSAAAQPGQGANGIWIATLLQGEEAQIENPHGGNARNDAVNRIKALLDEANARNHRVLCGFDFAFGYPEGTAPMIDPGNDWEDLWALIAQGDAGQLNDREVALTAAAELNQHFEGEGPFWGINLGENDPEGVSRRMPHNSWGQNLPPYRRHIERVFPGQSVWQVSGPGAVGLQTLTGIAKLQALRQGRDDVRVWPFQTLDGQGPGHVLAEIYPSLIDPWPGYAVPDQAQVHAVAARLSDLDANGELAVRLRAAENMPASVQNEEGLFLDIT